MKWKIWPCAIVAYFIVFIGGIVTWVTFAMRNNDQLVHPDYYAHEIQYQQQLDRLARTATLGKGVAVNYDFAASRISIHLPELAESKALTGTINLYRPSDATMDKSFPLALNTSNEQIIDVTLLQTGLWKVRLNWTGGKEDYYFEKSVVLGANCP